MGKCNIQAVPCGRRAGHCPTPLKFGNLLYGSMSLLSIFPCAFHPYLCSLPSSVVSAMWEDRWSKPCPGKGADKSETSPGSGQGLFPSWCLFHPQLRMVPDSQQAIEHRAALLPRCPKQAQCFTLLKGGT